MDFEGICLNCFSRRGEYEVCPWCGHVAGTPNAPAYLLQPGVRLWGRYVIGPVLGIGGFGVTYKAWDTRLAAAVAIKEFFPQNLSSRMPGETRIRAFSGDKMDAYAQQLARFVDEAKNLAKFAGSEHIVGVLDYFEDNGTAYIVMEYLEGETLKAHLARRGGALAAPEAAAVMEGLLQALSTIHAKGVIHRDISPDNLFMLGDGRVKVLDFGAARFAVRDDWTQSVVVKKGYAPPEQYRSNMKQGVWTDIYAAGATWYKMLTGQTPEESIERWEKDLLARPSAWGAQVDEATDKAVMKAMALRPELRFKSAAAMLAALRGESHPDFPEEELKKRKRTRGVSIALAAVAVVTALAIAGWQLGSAPATVSLGPTLADMNIAPAEFTVLVQDYNNEDGAFDELAAAFMEQYPQHRVHIMTMPYEQLQENPPDLGGEGAPTVYVPYWPDSRDDAADLTPLLSGLNTSDYYLMSRYSEDYEEANALPISFNFITAIAKADKAEAAGVHLPDTFTSYEQLLDIAAKDPKYLEMDVYVFLSLLRWYTPDLYKNGVYRPELAQENMRKYAEYMAMAQNADYHTTAVVGAEYAFINNLRHTLDGQTSDLQLVPIERNGRMYGYFMDEMCVNSHADANQQKAGMLFLHFLLSEYAQNRLYVQREDSLPLNRKAMEQFIAVRPMFAPLESKFDRIDFGKGDIPYGLREELVEILRGNRGEIDVDNVMKLFMEYQPTEED